jgi:hypothetical protein
MSQLQNAQPQNSSAHRHNAQMKARTRAIVALTLLVLWGMALFSGLIFVVVPSGRQSGWIEVLGLTKSLWGDVHLWVSLAASVVTVIHVAIDWKALKACSRFLVSMDRGETPCL